MRPIPSLTKDRLTRQGASLCMCWRITRTDNVILGLTDHDSALTFSGTTFRSIEGADGTALEAGVALSPDNADIIGVVTEDDFGRDDIDAGRFDEAHIEVWRVDWEDPSHRLLLKTGTLGEIKREGDGYRAEFRSLKHRLDASAGRVYSRSCDARLGEARCGVSISNAPYTVSGVVLDTAIREWTVSLSQSIAEDWFTAGFLRVDAGVMSGISRSIRRHSMAGEIHRIDAWEAMPKSLEAGTKISLVAGCDKKFDTCRNKFSNGLNFQGFPAIPGSDVLLRVQSTKRS